MDCEEKTVVTDKDKEDKINGLSILLTTDEDDARPVYLSGNFNNWATQDRRFVLQKVSDGKYCFKFPEDFIYPNELVYKFTNVYWSDLEIDRYGNKTPNRFCKKTIGTQEEHVPKWRKNWLPYRPSQLPKVHLISEEFEIPQLNKTRKIWALLPHDYET
jgi:hypothetical protein